MSLTVSPISNVSFRAQEAAPQSVEDILSRPGAFAKPEAVNQPTKKKHTFLKVAAGILITAGVIMGGLYGLKRGLNLEAVENLKDLKGMKMVKAYLTNAVVKGADYVEKGAEFIVEQAQKGWESLKGLFKGKGTPAS